MEEQRQHTRHHVTWRVAIIHSHYPNPIQAKAQEVSVSGAGIFVPVSLPIKTHCTLIFEIPNIIKGTRQYVESKATVVYCALVGTTGEFRTGFQFAKINDSLRHILGDQT